MIGYLALLLLGPWLLIMAWAYWSYPKSLPRTHGRRLVDAVAIVLAAVTAVLLTRYAFSSAAAYSRPGHIDVWQLTAPVLYAYGGFSAVLALGLLVRSLIWRR
jgi:hypothetical protein